jgi:probable HAF family extracellular repeat protein
VARIPGQHAPEGGYTFLEGVNDATQIVGYRYPSPGLRLPAVVTSFVYNGGSFTSVRDPQEVRPTINPGPMGGTFAQGMNNAGQIVGYYTGSGFAVHGFLCSGGTYTTLDDPLGAGGTYATGINNIGQIVGYFIDVNGGIHGFVYSGGAYTTVDNPSATGGTYVYGINDVGQIVGSWVDTSNHRHGFVGTLPNPPPPPGTTADMILRRGDGMYEIYDIGNNAILGAFQLGQVGTDWAFVTLGGFNGSDTTDMLLRNSNTGGFEVYDISNNQITGAAFLGTVGLDWQVMGFGNFSSLGENDMMLRNGGTGDIEVCDIKNNQITGARSA